MKLLSAIASAALIALLWLLFAPAQLGGRAHYVVVTGDSMEPALRSGDLAIVRSASDYQVGDVVTYRHPELGVVIHRIVGVDGTRFSVQGDNNAWVDSHTPAASEITGKLWIDIPGAGRYLDIARQPIALGLLALAAGATIMLPGRRNKHTQSPPGASVPPSLADPRGRDLLSLLAVLGIGALLLAGIAFTRPVERQASREVPYEHHGAFSYSAPAPEGIYDAAQVRSSEPIFRELVDAFDVQFDYAFESKAAVDASGTAALRAELRADNGWKRTFELQPATPFDGAATTLQGTVDLDELQRAIDRVERETGIAARQYRLSIQPDIALDARVAGQPVAETFAPALAFQMDAGQLQLIQASTPEESALEPGAGGLVTQRSIEPNALSLAGFELAIETARQVSAAALVLVLLTVAGLAAGSLRLRSRSDAERLAALYAARLVRVRPGAAGASGPAVELDSADDFERLLQHHAGPVFKDGPTFFIDLEGQRYRLRTHPYFSEADDEGTTQPIPLRAPSRPSHAIGQLLFARKQRAERA